MTYPIIWSGLVGSPGKFELGAQLVTQADAAKGTTTAHCEVALWFRTPYTVDEVGDIVWRAYASNGWEVTGIGAPALQGSNYTVQFDTVGFNVPITGRTPIDWRFDVGLDGLGMAGYASLAEVRLDGYIPYAAPPAATAVTATRVTDSRIDLSWSLVQDDAERVENVIIRRWDVKSGVTKTIKTLGYATGYSDRTTEPNNRYQYTVQPTNRSATGPAASSGYVSTKPAPPGTVKAGRTVSGDVEVTWVNLMRAPGVTEVWDNPDGNYAATTKVGEVAWPGESWTGAASVNQTHVYYLKHRTSDLPELTSDDSPDSNVVGLPSPPLAPTILGPFVMDPADDVPVEWLHNSADTTGQQAYEREHRLAGTSTWLTSGKVVSQVQAAPLPSGVYSPGDLVEVRVRTWGVHPDPGAWSPTSVVTMDARPVASILSPVGTVNASQIVVELAYHDAEDTTQSAAEVQLLDAVGAVVETVAIDGPGTLAPIQTRLADNTGYSIRARVRDGAGLWSQWDIAAITVDYLPPPTPQVAAAWVPEDGSVTLTLHHTAPTAGQVAATLYEVWRHGVLVATGLSPEPGAPVTITDPIPPVTGLVYDVVAWSTLPSSATAVVPLPDVRGIANRVWVNGGPGWSHVGSLVGNPTTDLTTERARRVEHFSGRSLPVETIGDAVTEQLKVSGLVPPGADHEVFARIQSSGTTVCVRWPEGRRFVSMGPVDTTARGTPAGHAIGFQATTIDWQE